MNLQIQKFSEIGNRMQKFENTWERITVSKKDGVVDRKIANETYTNSTTIK